MNLTGMERFFEWLLQCTWQASVIVVMILLVQFFLRKRLSPAWRYGLWMLLVARLLMPGTPSSAISVFNVAKWPQPRPLPVAAAALPSAPISPAAPIESHAALQIAAPAQPLAIAETAIIAPPSTPAGVTETREIAVPVVSARPLNWERLAFGVWLAGVLLLMLRFFWVDIRFRRRLAHHVPMSDGSVMRLLNQSADSLGVSRSPLVIETEEVDSPAVYGLWRKRLLLPDGLCEQLSPGELQHVLLHELAHMKRRDPEVHWLLAILQILHWFNPVLWFAFARMRADRELATDDLALSRTEPSDRRLYGETVLKLLDGITQRRAMPALIGIAESKAQMKERIRVIARGVGPRWRWAAASAAAIIASVALTGAEQPSKSINLLERYPTTLTQGDDDFNNARPWEFTPSDIYQVSRFTLEAGKQLHVEMGIADLGIGHCRDGSVWAVLIPRTEGKITSSAAANSEAIEHVWLRFHPSKVNSLFPPETVSVPASADLEEKMRAIAEFKLGSSWHAGLNVIIPGPKDLTVDVDTKSGPRRFFAVDTVAQTSEYIDGFANHSFKPAAQPSVQIVPDTNCPSVVSVTPANGARDVELAQELHIRFDRPMNPAHMKLQWLAGGFQLNGSIQTDADQKGFVIPVRLTPGQEQRLAVNQDDYREMRANSKQPDAFPRDKDGFVDATGAPANEFRWSFRTKARFVKPGAAKPRVVSATPASGSTAALLSLVRVTFDQPMQGADVSFPFEAKNAFMNDSGIVDSFEYDPTTRTFAFPVLLRPDDDVRLTLKGFYSADGVASDPVVLHYQTGPENLDADYTARAKASASNPDMQKLLAGMKEARARINSGVETVQTFRLSHLKDSCNQIRAESATFKWQGSNQVYADITGPMGMSRAFILGSDGRNCWLYSEDDNGKKRLEQAAAAVTRTDIDVLDPFGLAKRSVQDVLAKSKMAYMGKAQLNGRSCYRLQKWEVSIQGMPWASITEWWIDSETLLPTQSVQYNRNNSQVVRFDFKDLNQPLPDSAFTPPVVDAEKVESLWSETDQKTLGVRFLQIYDGASGRMSGRMGFSSEQGSTSAGLN